MCGRREACSLCLEGGALPQMKPKLFVATPTRLWTGMAFSASLNFAAQHRLQSGLQHDGETPEQKTLSYRRQFRKRIRSKRGTGCGVPPRLHFFILVERRLPDSWTPVTRCCLTDHRRENPCLDEYQLAGKMQEL